MDVYTAIAKAGIQTVSQGFESAGNYFADGQWDSADTGATAIDVAMAGLYAIPHALTGGLDDLVFGWVDKAAGGDGNPEMFTMKWQQRDTKSWAKKLVMRLVNGGLA